MLYNSLFARDINIDEIVKKTLTQNKYLFILLHKTNCGYCERMIDFTLDDDAVKALIKKDFVYEHINIKDKDTIIYKDFKGSGRDFSKYMGYDFYPTSLFIDKNNNLVYLSLGYQTEEGFLKILKYVSSGSYKKMDYVSFEKNSTR